jgi:hypothetical protein
MWLLTFTTKDRTFVAFSDIADRDKATTACKRQIRRLAGKRLNFDAYRAVRFNGGNVTIEVGTPNVEWENPQ